MRVPLATPRARRAVAVALLGAAVVAGCGSGQDPDVQPSATSGGPRTTSRLLEACPPGGPDATTPAAGCLEDGVVVTTSTTG